MNAVCTLHVLVAAAVPVPVALTHWSFMGINVTFQDHVNSTTVATVIREIDGDDFPTRTYGNPLAVMVDRLRKRNRESGTNSADPSKSRAILDVGAHVGVVSIALALAVPSAVVLAVEANRASFEHLRWNIQRNNATNVVPLHAALVAPEHSGQRRVLVVAPNGRNTGGATLHVRSLREAEAEAEAEATPPTEDRAQLHGQNAEAVASVLGTWATMPVRTVSLDDAIFTALSLAASTGAGTGTRRVESNDETSCANHELALLKIDCEGCEHHVLAPGRCAALEQGRIANVIGELHLNSLLRQSGADPDAVELHLRRKVRGVVALARCHMAE